MVAPSFSFRASELVRLPAAEIMLFYGLYHCQLHDTFTSLQISGQPVGKTHRIRRKRKATHTTINQMGRFHAAGAAALEMNFNPKNVENRYKIYAFLSTRAIFIHYSAIIRGLSDYVHSNHIILKRCTFCCTYSYLAGSNLNLVKQSLEQSDRKG